jgi:predicted permease
MFTRLASIVGNVLRRSRVEDDLDAELRFHLQARAEDLARRGLPRAEAERRARLEFGAIEGFKEDCREARGLRVFDELAGNLRYALRSLRHTPGVSAVAVVSLALGIGANIAIFSVVNAVALKPLPVRDPGRLVLLSWTAKDFPERYVQDIEGAVDSDPRTGWTVSADFSSRTVDAIAAHNRVFSDVLAFSENIAPSNISIGGRADAGGVLGVSGGYFDALGVAAAAGRVLHPSDDGAGAASVAVASWPFWQRMLGGGPAVGAVLVVNGTPVTVVGVAPQEFSGLQPGRAPDLYVPLHAYADHHRRAFSYDLHAPHVWWLAVVGRLKPGVTEAQARSDVGGLFHGSLGISGAAADDGSVPRMVTAPVGRGLDGLRKQFSEILALLMAMVGIVLLVACGNVASLLVARAAARQRDLAVRVSLGASRARVVRQLLTESVLLGLLGGALGLLLGAWISQAVVASLADGPREPIALSVRLDAAVLVFTLVVSVASGVLFGAVPALRAMRGDLGRALTRRSDAGLLGRRTIRSGKLLVGAQVALCVLLLVGAGLLAGTLGRLQHVTLGFNPQGIVVLKVQPGLNEYADDRLGAYYEGLQRAVGALPGVRGVALTQHGLIGSGWSQGMAELSGAAPLKRVRFWRQWVSEGFFETLGIPLVAGRRLGPEDGRIAPHAVVVNRRFVRDYLHGESPLGRTFKDGDWVGTVVGVVGDAKYGSLRDEAPPTAYLPYRQSARQYPASMILHARVEGDAGAAVGEIRRAVLALDPAVPPIMIQTQQEVINRALFAERTLAALSGAFGLLALALASVGLFGTMSYAVARRTGEIGVRMALGAPRPAVLRMVLRETMAIAAAGVAVGLPLAWLGSRLMAGLLFGLSPHDPGTIGGAVSVVLAVTLASGALPAIRASRVDPMTALREE